MVWARIKVFTWLTFTIATREVTLAAVLTSTHLRAIPAVPAGGTRAITPAKVSNKVRQTQS